MLRNKTGKYIINSMYVLYVCMCEIVNFKTSGLKFEIFQYHKNVVLIITFGDFLQSPFSW